VWHLLPLSDVARRLAGLGRAVGEVVRDQRKIVENSWETAGEGVTFEDDFLDGVKRGIHPRDLPAVPDAILSARRKG
jgi:hypothetical protein